MTIINAGFATTSEEDLEGLGYLQNGLPGTFRNLFDRFRYQMYHYAVIENGFLESLGGQVLLETGCGRGGGLNYLSQVLRPRQAIGIDLSAANIEYCRQHWPKGSHVHTQFIRGDAEALSSMIPRLSIDVAVDIEGFFYYQDKQAFLREIHSVLRERGTFYLAFFIQRTRLEEIHRMIRLYFDIAKEDDITDNVLMSLRLDSQRIARFAD